MRAPRFRLVAIGSVAVGLAACGSGDTATTTDTSTGDSASVDDAGVDSTVGDTDGLQRHPDIVDASARASGDTWTFDVTVSSPYDSPERYADGWRILGPDGTEYGFRLLTHDHAAEQPFTRSLSNVEIPDDVDTVVIEGRDQQYGFGGTTFELTLPDS